MLISNKVKVLAGIEQGSIYSFCPQNGVNRHYYVVISKNPQSHKEIYLLCFTTKKNTVLKLIESMKLSEKTYIETKTNDCPDLPRRTNTGLNCNRPICLNKEDLIILINDTNGSCNYKPLKKSTLKKVLKGVIASDMVNPLIKKLCNNNL